MSDYTTSCTNAITHLLEHAQQNKFVFFAHTFWSQLQSSWLYLTTCEKQARKTLSNAFFCDKHTILWFLPSICCTFVKKRLKRYIALPIYYLCIFLYCFVHLPFALLRFLQRFCFIRNVFCIAICVFNHLINSQIQRFAKHT